MKNAILIGDKIYFRSLERSDIDKGWHDWINDSVIRENLNGVFPVNREELERYWETSVPPATVMFAVCDKETGQYIGNARLSDIDWVNRRCTYGRLIGVEEFRGRGYGTEILVLLMRYAFLTLGMNRIATGTLISNEASIRSNEKAGMTREGVYKEVMWKDGGYQDAVFFGITRADYDQLSTPEKT
jgi:RimJ/RimL family protein N-acetyltransferase